MSRGFCLPRDARIRRSRDFKEIYARGRKTKGPHLTLYYLPNQLEQTRLGLSVTKARFKLSITRHLIQRRLREVFRLTKARFLPGYDIVIAAQRFDKDKTGFEDIKKELLFLAQKAGLLKTQDVK